MDPNLKALLMAALTLAQAQVEKCLAKLGNDKLDLKKVLTNLEQTLVQSLEEIVIHSKNT